MVTVLGISVIIVSLTSAFRNIAARDGHKQPHVLVWADKYAPPRLYQQLLSRVSEAGYFHQAFIDNHLRIAGRSHTDRELRPPDCNGGCRAVDAIRVRTAAI